MTGNEQKNCCCRWGAAVSGEYPEFGCAKCDIHQGGLGETETELCRRHRHQIKEYKP